jgi:1-acyl-sn-glycerol-3-phosphate acyltransferase
LAELTAHRAIRGRTIGQWVAFVTLNLWFWTLAPIVFVIYVLLAAVYVLVFLAVTRNRRRTERVIRLLIGYYAAVTMRLPWPWVRLKWVDYEPGAKPPFVIVANHRSSSDAFLMGCLPWECVMVLNIWAGRIPLMGLIATLASFLRVREMPFEEFAAKGSKLLNEGCSVVAFPEGTRSGSARLNPFHGSSFRLAQMNRVKIVPLAIFGNEHIPTRGTFWLNPGRVIVSKLRSVKPDEYEGMSAYKLKTTVRGMISDHLEGQAKEEYGG